MTQGHAEDRVPLHQVRQIVADFLEEWPRRFLWALLDLTGRQEAGGGLRLGELALPWSAWCDLHAAELDAYLDPWTDTQARGVYEELVAFLAYALLSHGAAQGHSPQVLDEVRRGIPSLTPFGPLDLRALTDAYAHTSNAVVTFAERAAHRAPPSQDLREHLVTIAVHMGRVSERVASVLPL
ncbi:MAG: hypothetical protein JXX28_11950 [Deltaproteobacteria bacterium]|nr:hypothetical protein [Deltaproteobacteria bacterium]